MPTSVIGDQNGRIWIADLSNAKISVWDQNFEHLHDIHFQQGWNTGFKKTKQMFLSGHFLQILLQVHLTQQKYSRLIRVQ